jgi:hypothetical protein
MTSDQAMLWLLAGVAALTLAGYLWGLARDAAARRARRQRFHRELATHRPSRGATLSGSMSRDRAATVRREAENAGRLVAAGIASEPRNPYRQGTAEFVLWVATYHLTLAELRDEVPLSQP